MALLSNYHGMYKLTQDESVIRTERSDQVAKGGSVLRVVDSAGRDLDFFARRRKPEKAKSRDSEIVRESRSLEDESFQPG